MPKLIRYDADPVRSSLLSLSYTLSHSAEAVKLHILTLSISGLKCPTICCLSSVVKYNKLCTRKTGIGVKTWPSSNKKRHPKPYRLQNGDVVPIVRQPPKASSTEFVTRLTRHPPQREGRIRRPPGKREEFIIHPGENFDNTYEKRLRSHHATSQKVKCN